MSSGTEWKLVNIESFQHGEVGFLLVTGGRFMCCGRTPRACDQTRTAWDLTRAHYIMQRSLEFGVHVHAVLCLSDGERAVGFWWGVGPCDKWSGWGHAGASEAQLLFGIIYRCENCLLDSLEVFSTDGTCLKAGNLHMSVWHQLSKCSPQMVEVKYFEPTFLLQPWLLRNIIAHISLKSPMIWGIIRWLKNKRCRASYLSNIILRLAVCKKMPRQTSQMYWMLVPHGWPLF